MDQAGGSAGWTSIWTLGLDMYITQVYTRLLKQGPRALCFLPVEFLGKYLLRLLLVRCSSESLHHCWAPQRWCWEAPIPYMRGEGNAMKTDLRKCGLLGYGHALHSSSARSGHVLIFSLACGFEDPAAAAVGCVCHKFWMWEYPTRGWFQLCVQK